ncbi:MAG TPA: hypothetical protein VNY27_02530 [Solirubrobacteraceae bacterium]|nr:hypothetical protein [Solirubrobacteraceae bacterium]
MVLLCALAGGLCASAPALAAECPNEQIRIEQGSTRLPDCRAYEMVSPVYKGGYGALTIVGVAPGGEGAAFSSLGAFAGSPASYPTNSHYLARRGAGGWQTSPLIPPATVAPNGLGAEFVSADLALTLFEGEPGPSSGAAQSGAVETDFFVHPTDAPDTPENWAVAGMALQPLERGGGH